MAILTDEQVAAELAAARRKKQKAVKEKVRDVEIRVKQERKTVADAEIVPVKLLHQQMFYRVIGVLTAVPFLHDWAVRKEAAALKAQEAFFRRKVDEIEQARQEAAEDVLRLEALRKERVVQDLLVGKDEESMLGHKTSSGCDFETPRALPA